MAVDILRPAPESAGARRASAIERAELVSSAESTKVPDPEVSDRAVRRLQKGEPIFWQSVEVL